MNRLQIACSGLLLAQASFGAAPKPSPHTAVLLQFHKIWDEAKHNAFTDLARFQNHWICAFREGTAHESPDGSIRILISEDGSTWTSTALLRRAGEDLRDPKLSITPDGRLMVDVGIEKSAAMTHDRSAVYFSSDGIKWTDPVEVGPPGKWLWRIAWHKGTAYSISYERIHNEYATLFASRDGKSFHVLADHLMQGDGPDEAALAFEPDDTALCLIRREVGDRAAWLGRSRPPYQHWDWVSLHVPIGGPCLLVLPDGTVLAAGRRSARAESSTVLYRLDATAGKLTELLTLPSGGDTSYPGLVWYGGTLWMSYYSSHTGRTSVYIAQIKLANQ